MALSDPLADLNVSRETYDAIDALEALVSRWTKSINLVGKSTLGALRERHTLDSAQLFQLADPSAVHWVDLGSGGGFPGLVVAIIARELRPNLKFTLIDADVRKTIFLREAVRVLGLETAVIAGRIETIPPQSADVLSARALADLPTLLSYAERHLVPGGIALLPKGARRQDEITAASEGWSFRCDSVPSVSQPDAAILIVREIRRAKPT